MRISPFFELPKDNEQFYLELNSIEAKGGTDKSNGLEALSLALKSDFTQGPKDRQVIVLLTNNEAFELKERAGSAGYPSDMVDQKKLVEIWICMREYHVYKISDKTKRLLICAPKGTKYEELAMRLNRCFYKPIDPTDGAAVNFIFNDYLHM